MAYLEAYQSLEVTTTNKDDQIINSFVRRKNNLRLLIYDKATIGTSS
jgi:hypothetical protein